MTAYQAGQRVIYTRRGELRHYDTAWPAVYLRLSQSGRHVIRIDGRNRVSIVRDASLHAAASAQEQKK